MSVKRSNALPPGWFRETVRKPTAPSGGNRLRAEFITLDPPHSPETNRDAALTVAGMSKDAEQCGMLLDMLGLDRDELAAS